MNFTGNAWRLSPSDLTFLYEECLRCFWMKVAGGLPRPRAPFPKVFSLLDSQTKRYFAGKRTTALAAGIRPGRVFHGDRWVRSSPISVGEDLGPVLLAGRFDSSFRFDDGTFGLVDFKTTEPKLKNVQLYARQLHAYALAAERPAPGSLELDPITQMGLLCFEPTELIRVKAGFAYRTAASWIEIPRDDEAFLEFLAGAVRILERPEPPEGSSDCQFCQYLTSGSLALLTSVFGAA